MDAEAIRENGLTGNKKSTSSKGTQNLLIGGIGGSLITLVGTFLFVYFNTNFMLDHHDARLDKVEIEIVNIKDDIGDIKTDVATINTDVGYLKDGQTQMQEDIKDIYRVVLALKNK